MLDGPDDLYAVSQGALACQCRRDDLQMMEMLSMIHDETSGLSCVAERALMRSLAGGCHTPIAVRSDWLTPDSLQLRAAVFHPDRPLEPPISAALQVRLPMDDSEEQQQQEQQQEEGETDSSTATATTTANETDNNNNKNVELCPPLNEQVRD